MLVEVRISRRQIEVWMLRALSLAFVVTTPAFAIATDPAIRMQAKGSGAPQSRTSKEEPRPDPDKLAPQARAALIEITKVPILQVQSTDLTPRHKDTWIDNPWSHDWWLVYLTAALAAYTALLYRATVRLGKDAATNSDTRGKETKRALDLAERSADAAKSSADASMLAERAYITASFKLPGVKWEKDGLFEVHLAVKNHGRTPGTVSDVQISCKVLESGEPLVDTAIPPREVTTKALLVPTDSIEHARAMQLYGAGLDAVETYSKTLWVFGHVDYIDTFRVRHRFGFARAYNRTLDDGKKQNLVRQSEGDTQYDYDRTRTRDEGVDWGEPVTGST